MTADRLVRTESGLLVPAARERPTTTPPAPPQMLLLDGIPVPIKLFGALEKGHLELVQGWYWTVQGVNPWCVQLRVRCPTARLLKKIGEPQKLEGGDLEWRSEARGTNAKRD